jgi:hypothetical protein
MSAYLNDLIKELEAEAERGRARAKKCEAFNASRRSQERDEGALRRIAQRLEILKALQKTESNRRETRRRSILRSMPLSLPRPPSKKTKTAQQGHGPVRSHSR